MTDRALVNAKGEPVSPCCRVVMDPRFACCPFCGKAASLEGTKR